jgi:hypothetical protein
LFKEEFSEFYLEGSRPHCSSFSIRFKCMQLNRYYLKTLSLWLKLLLERSEVSNSQTLIEPGRTEPR